AVVHQFQPERYLYSAVGIVAADDYLMDCLKMICPPFAVLMFQANNTKTYLNIFGVIPPAPEYLLTASVVVLIFLLPLPVPQCCPDQHFRLFLLLILPPWPMKYRCYLIVAIRIVCFAGTINYSRLSVHLF